MVKLVMLVDPRMTRAYNEEWLTYVDEESDSLPWDDPSEDVVVDILGGLQDRGGSLLLDEWDGMVIATCRQAVDDVLHSDDSIEVLDAVCFLCNDGMDMLTNRFDISEDQYLAALLDICPAKVVDVVISIVGD